MKEEIEEKNDSEMTETIENTDDMTDDLTFEELHEDGEVDIKATLKKLRLKIKTLEQEKKEYLGGWQRAQADYANFKKEVDAKRKDDIKFANRRLILEILPVLDAYDMAKTNKEAWEKVDHNWRIGIEYIFGILVATLEREGVTQYGNENDIFDPTLYESVESVETDDEEKDTTVAQILQKGYKTGDTILRVSRVKVYQKGE